MTAASVTCRRAAVVRAHSKLILIGEHAVVHGQPAVALPFLSVGVEAAVEPVLGPLSIDCAFYRGPMASAPETLRGLVACVLETLRRLESRTSGLLLRLASTIPPGSGLGSSAAVAVAAVRGVFACHGQEAEHSELMSLANIAEVHAHGTPSGIDTLAAAADRPLWFVKGRPSEPLPTGAAFELVVADSGRIGDTKSAVSAVSSRLQAEPARTEARLGLLGELAQSARAALAQGDAVWLGKILDRAQAELSALGVSDLGLNTLLKVAREAGALGAKLTGGGRGGCILALAKDGLHAERLAAKLARAGARATWRFTLGKEN